MKQDWIHSYEVSTKGTALKLLFSVDYIRACALVIPSVDAFFCGYYIVGCWGAGVEAFSEENHLLFRKKCAKTVTKTGGP